MRVLGKEQLSGAIRLNELEQLMDNFAPQPQVVEGKHDANEVVEYINFEQQEPTGKKKKDR
jgi:hypothetical protein